MASSTRSASADVLTMIQERMAAARKRGIGFPGATDIDFTDVLPLHQYLINNVGDPQSDGLWSGHVKDIEREVIATFATLFGGSSRELWGYITAGGSTEGVLHGMWLGRERRPGTRVYYSAAAHYCVSKAARLLRIEATVVPAGPDGEMQYDALAAAVHAHRERPAMVVATAGTTMAEAVDDVPSIHEALDAAGAAERYIVVDGALAGPTLALDGTASAYLLGEQSRRNRGDADAVCFSSHKSFGTPHVGGVALARREHVERVRQAVDYLAGTDSTISGSRSGHVVVELWHVLTTLGLDGLRGRAQRAREVASYAARRLADVGWPAWRHPRAWTVVLAEPPADLVARWALATSGGWSHIVCAPGITTDVIDAFVTELVATHRHEEDARGMAPPLTLIIPAARDASGEPGRSAR